MGEDLGAAKVRSGGLPLDMSKGTSLSSEEARQCPSSTLPACGMFPSKGTAAAWGEEPLSSNKKMNDEI